MDDLATLTSGLWEFMIEYYEQVDGKIKGNDHALLRQFGHLFRAKSMHHYYNMDVEINDQYDR